MALHTRQSNRLNTTLSSWDMAILEYLPLEGDRDIRLMDIFPGVLADTLRVHVYHTTLSETERPSYDALSYVWGSPDVPVKVDVQVTSTEGIVSDHHVSITQNLATALKHLRYPNASRTVWADAICINQNDYIERSRQVLIMGDIYRSARKVVAFLGPEKDDSSYALEILQQLSDAVEVDFSSGHVKPSPAVASDHLWSDMKQSLPFHHRELPAIYRLVHREWFERLWVRQEIGLGGRNAVLLCGAKELPWLSFCRAIFVIWRKPVNADNVFDATEYRTFRDRLRNADAAALYSMRAFRFTNLRRQIGESKCSDQRDRIYAVLGQLRDTDQIGIIPDYAKTVAEVYVDATRKHIKHFGNLSILCQCELGWSNPEPAIQLPSWVPDWSRTMRSSAVHAVIPPLFDLLPFMAPVADQLQVYGTRCGIVRRVSRLDDEILHSGSDEELLRKLKYVLPRVCDDSSVRDMYGNRDSTLEACCRTLFLNNFDNRWNPPVPHEAPYQDCLYLIRALAESDIRAELPAIPNRTRCLDRIRESCRGRAIVTTEEGRIGLAPDAIAVGDEVCVLFRSYKPMALRLIPNISSTGSLQHRVVGECYLHDMMQGEAILGKIPENLRGLLDSNGLMGLRSAGFMDTRTGEIHEDDPRMEPFLGKLVQTGLLVNPTLEELEQRGALEVLTSAGFPVQLFHIG